MKFSRSLKSSTQSLPSPDGAYVATLFPSQLSILSTRSLTISRVISLPPDLLITWFLWSASSNRILLASADLIRVYSISNTKFVANITNASTTKITLVCFGGNEDEVMVFTEYGLKVSIYNLGSGRAVDINSPKFYSAGTAGRGYSYRENTGHLGLLTRSGGKDIISIHAPGSLEVVRSWVVQSIDAQGICWSKDGRWIVIWESAAQGHRIFVYTADGHLFKTWNGPFRSSEDVDVGLGAGIKGFEWCGNGGYIAVGDFSERVTLLATPSFSEAMSLVHPAAVDPAESLQIWQEQIVPSQDGRFDREFIQATQSICPPTIPSPPTNTDAKTGTNFLLFDKSGTLLGTRTESMPTTLFIWDIASTRSLRAVIILHSPIAKATWHPSINELLMIRCEGDRGVVHLWDPSWEQPKIIDFARQIPGGKVLGKTVVRWLNAEQPAIFFSDSQDCMMVSLSDEEGEVPWQDAGFGLSYGEGEESPLQLVPADERGKGKGLRSQVSIADLIEDEDDSAGWGDEEVEVEDTFHFRKFVE